MDYRRVFVPGGCYFFTVVTFKREPLFNNAETIQKLLDAFQWTRQKYPFSIEALVILPDHLHTIWSLPDGDSNYPLRWNLLKGYFSKNCTISPKIIMSQSRKQKREKEVWQRRYWEHLISNEEDFIDHIEYVHNNPIKHGLVEDAHDWKYSTIHKYSNLKFR